MIFVFASHPSRCCQLVSKRRQCAPSGHAFERSSMLMSLQILRNFEHESRNDCMPLPFACSAFQIAPINLAFLVCVLSWMRITHAISARRNLMGRRSFRLWYDVWSGGKLYASLGTFKLNRACILDLLPSIEESAWDNAYSCHNEARSSVQTKLVSYWLIKGSTGESKKSYVRPTDKGEPEMNTDKYEEERERASHTHTQKQKKEDSEGHFLRKSEVIVVLTVPYFMCADRARQWQWYMHALD